MKFYHKDESIIERWITALKDICILLDLDTEYKWGELIGRGNYGSVNASHKIGDPN